jgi:hypothetical protein
VFDDHARQRPQAHGALPFGIALGWLSCGAGAADNDQQHGRIPSMRFYLSIAIALMLTVPCSASAATVPVTQLSGQFAATNPSVASTNDGVQFGPYANGGSAVGSLYYAGANGLTLNGLDTLGFTESHNTTDDNAIASPYLRIYLNGDAHDVIFDATKCAAIVPAENTFNHFQVIGTQVRYDDDGCDGAGDHNYPGSPPGEQTWPSVIASHGDEVISGIYITTGRTGGLDLSALVTSLTVNGDTFCFNCAPPTPGPVVIVSAPPTVNTAASGAVVGKQTCHGNTARKLHAPKRRGQRFLTTRASLRGKALRVRGRTITANLTGQPEANYNVRITSRYRTHSGRIVTVKTTRNLSVVCS